MATFPQKLVAAIVCQNDGAPLSQPSPEGDIVDGALVCTECRKEYPVRGGILDLLETENLSINEANEIKARDDEAESYDKRLAAREAREIPSNLAYMGDVKGKRIIEYGAGTGRITEHLKEADQILAVDFSEDSLIELGKKEIGPEVGLVRANVTTLKTASNYFDLAVSSQVVEHIEEELARYRWYANTRRTLKDGGQFIISSYHQDLRRRLKNKEATGLHKSGVYYRYFRQDELVRELKTFFAIGRAGKIDIELPIISRFLPASMIGALSRILEHIPLLRELGHLVIVLAHKNPGSRYRFGWPLTKIWCWLENPVDLRDVSMSNFFSYEDVDVPGFRKKGGLTTVVDLSPDIETIWEGMRQKFIRKQITQGENKGISVKIGLRPEDYAPIYKPFRRGKGLSVDSLNFLHDAGLVVSAELAGETLAGGAFLTNGETMRAWALSSIYVTDKQKQNLIGQANRILIWEMIKFAKATGHQYFDLGGINVGDDGKVDSLTEFKEAFGGERKNCYFYHKVYSPLLRSYMKLRGMKVS